MRVNILGEHKCEILMGYRGGKYLQSYKSIVAFKDIDGTVTLYPKWNYSRTTAKHVGQWLEISAKEIHKRIKEGKIKVHFCEPDI